MGSFLTPRVLALFPALQSIDWIRFARLYQFSTMKNRDLPSVIALERSVFPEPWPLRVFIYELNTNSSAYAYTIRHRITRTIHGYIMFRIRENMAHLTNLVVAPAVQGRGIGTALLGFGIIKSIWLGARWMQLEVRVSNTRAIRLYKKFGFDIVYTMPSYYSNGEDAYVMVLPYPFTEEDGSPYNRDSHEF